MSLGKQVALYAITLVVFLGIDTVWLVTMSDRFYKKNLGDLMRESPNLPVALGFYLLYVLVLLIVVVMPAVDKGSLAQAAGFGVLLGLAAYGTYDITNLSTIRDWPVVVTIVDLIWGGTLTGVVSTVGYLVANWLK
jgi:uncharacterized membrane protein